MTRNSLWTRAVLILLLTGAMVAVYGGHDVRLSAQSGVSVTVNGAQQFQTIDGFGVNVNVASWNGGELRPALDLLIDQLGANIFRVVIDNADWEDVNDDASAQVFNWDYYRPVYTSPKFEELWATLAYLNQRGAAGGVILNVMGPVPSWMGGSQIWASAEDEWVEMIASLVYYGRVTRGLQFSMLSPMNEPDWDGIEGPQVDQWQYARLMRKLSQRLDSIGLSDVRFVGPDTASVSAGVNAYLPEMMGDAVVMAKVDHFGLHNYAGDSGGAEAAIRSSAYPTRNFWITEVTNIWDILAHLSQGPSAALVWDAYDSVYNHAILAGRGTTPPNDVGNGPPLLAYSSSSGTYTPRKGFYEVAQLFRFVGAGSRRIGASDSSSNLTLLAFQGSGRITLVGRNASSGSMTLTGTLSGLPSVARFELYQTTSSLNMQRGTDVSVSNGAFTVQVAGGSVFTLTALTGSDQAPPTVVLTAPTPGATVSGLVSVSAAASDDTGVAGVQFLVDGGPLGAEDLTAPFTAQWSSNQLSDGSHVLSARARDAAGNTTTSAGVTVNVRNVDAVPPAVALTGPLAGATVAGLVTLTAEASDDVAVGGVQFLLDGAPIGGEDTTAPFLFVWDSTQTTNGPHSLGARARDLAGNVSTSAGRGVTVSNGPPQPPPSGLVAAYGFEEGNGAVTADSSLRGHTGTITGAAWSSTGRFGRALLFDGENDLVTVADAAALDLTDRMTLEAWVRPSTTGAWHTVLLKEGPSGLSYGLYSSDESGRPSAYLRIGGDVGATGPTTVPVNTWSHLALTYDGTALRLYVNGVLAATRSVTGSASTSSNPLRVGGNVVWGEYFAGLIDEVRVYDRALTPAEIQADMETPVVSTSDTPPQVSLNLPVDGAVVSGVVVLSATATDNVGVAGVQFLVNGVPLGAEVTAAPYTSSWDVTGLAAGTYRISATARDTSGQLTTSTASTVVVGAADTAPPSVTVTSPTSGATVSGAINVTAAASDAVGVVGVQFFLDGQLLGQEDAGAPYSTSLATTTIPNGPHVLIARARDAAGNVASSASVPFIVANSDITTPVVTITGIPQGASLTGTVVVAAAASDNVGVVGVQFLVDGSALGSEDTTAPYSVAWNTLTGPNGAHVLSARARDAAGNVATATVGVTVANDVTPPVVSMTAPGAGATVAAIVTVSATATDAGGVAGVQFLLNGVALGTEDTAAPYSILWNTAGASNGVHTLAARARDASGNTATATRTVTVSNAPPVSLGLVAAYAFEEGAGTAAADGSGRGHTGTVTGATWVQNGRFGRALSFDGVNDLVSVADTTALDLTNGMTLEAWVRPSSTAAWRTVLLKERSGGLSYGLYASNGASRPSGYIRIGGDIDTQSTSSLPVNAWSHVAVTYNGSVLRLYVNGTQVASRNQTGSISTSSNPLRIGGNLSWGEYFAGLIDEVRVYNRALSQSEIQSDMVLPVR